MRQELMNEVGPLGEQAGCVLTMLRDRESHIKMGLPGAYPSACVGTVNQALPT